MSSKTTPPPPLDDQQPSIENEANSDAGADTSTKPALSDTDVLLRSYKTSLLLLLTTYQTHFRSLGYIKDSTLELLDRTVSKRTVQLTVRDSRARDALGTNAKIWTELVEVFRNAIASLDGRCYADTDFAAAVSVMREDETLDPEDGPSSTVIVANSATLLADLQRLDALLAITRNVLTAGEKVQNLAAQTGFDREVCALINLAVKVTARGFDGDGGQADEDRFLSVANGFKKVLITSLQFLSNLVTMNERLKLMLWVELFDSTLGHAPLKGATGSANAETKSAVQQIDDSELHPSTSGDTQEGVEDDQLSGDAVDDTTKSASRNSSFASQDPPLKKPSKPLTPYLIYLRENKEKIQQELMAKNPNLTSNELVREGTRRWNDMPEKDKDVWRKAFEESLEKYEEDLEAWKAARADSGSKNPSKTSDWDDEENNATRAAAEGDQSSRLSHNLRPRGDPTSNIVGLDARTLPLGNNGSYGPNFDILSPPPPPPDSNFRIIESASDGIKKLEEGKLQLLKRLDHDAVSPGGVKYDLSSPRESQLASPTFAAPEEQDKPAEGEDEREDEYDDEEDDEADEDYLDSEEEESSDEEEYAIPGEDGRGLLTDVPLILGPNEIEVLPMIIMSGIVADWKGIEPPSDTLLNMYTIRCHLLLAQENGRNLLRELLIFVAAWDLREDELYFKFMVKIIEAILLNGLMPFAYGTFKEVKDIISPAQAVIMKLLTKIFHSRQAYVSTDPEQNPVALLSNNTYFSPVSNPDDPAAAAKKNEWTSGPPRPDIQTVHFLFTEFRTSIIPQICALVFLQGQIRAGHAQLEDFPLNLWDMERMYEGVYQYLEFFAILTDHDVWKERMAEWEVVSELVTLLRELEAAIPKKSLGGGGVTAAAGGHQHYRPATTSQAQQSSENSQTPSPDPQPQPATAPVPVAVERPYDVSTSPDATATTPESVSEKLKYAKQALESRRAAAAAAAADGTLPPPPTPPPAPPGQPLHDEPADFEWRNLKKLCVLVLSSLVWKNRTLQDQVRRFGGINVLLSCCGGVGGIDEHNPYIREHAIMCLRFLIEGNEECADVVRGLANRGHAQAQARKAGEQPAEARKGSSESQTTSAGQQEGQDKVTEGSASVRDNEPGPDALDGAGEDTGILEDLEGTDNEDVLTVPAEVLDHHGYETFMDAKGQVGLRRKELPASAVSSYQAAARDSNQNYHDSFFGVAHGKKPGEGGDADGGFESEEQASQAQNQTQQIPPPKNPAHLPEWMQMVMKSLPKADVIGSASSSSGAGPSAGGK